MAKPDRAESDEAVYWLAAIVESSDDAIIGKTTDGIITSWNAGAEQIYGYSAKEAIGRHISFLAPPERRDDIALILGKAARGIRVEHFETMRVRKDGKLIDVSLTISPIKDYRGRIVGVSTIARDITERKKMETRLKKASELNAALNRINVAINSTLDFRKIMQRVVVESTKALQADAAVIELHEANRWPIRFLVGLPENLFGKSLTDEEFLISELVAKEQRPVAINDTARDSRVDPRLVDRYGIYSILAVPLMVKGFITGILIFPFHKKFVQFTEEEIDFAEKLGAAVSLALENARIYTAEHSIAHTLQEALLVVPESVQGLDIGYLYQSASQEALVGGDFYDLFSLEDGLIAMVIGDVSGKGISAAALTAFIGHTMKAYAFQGDTPGSVMKKTNDLLNRVSKEAAFITIFFGILDTKTGQLTYCNAGHPPGILKRSADDVELLGTSGPIVGAMPGLIYNERLAILSPDDMLVLYTDGVIEARQPDGTFFGEERLLEITNERMSAQEMPHHIFDKLSDFVGGTFADDVAILCIRLEGGEGHV